MGARVEKTRGAGTYTESGFWGMIRSTLRQKSRWWTPIKIVKEASRRAYKGENKRQKWEYSCAMCGEWFSEKEIAIDHIVEAGSLKNGDDLKDFIEKLFCEKEGLQVLCDKRLDGKKSCHKKKTESYMNLKK